MNRIAPAGPSRSVSAFQPSIRISYNDIDDGCVMLRLFRPEVFQLAVTDSRSGLVGDETLASVDRHAKTLAPDRPGTNRRPNRSRSPSLGGLRTHVHGHQGRCKSPTEDRKSVV